MTTPTYMYVGLITSAPVLCSLSEQRRQVHCFEQPLWCGEHWTSHDILSREFE